MDDWLSVEENALTTDNFMAREIVDVELNRTVNNEEKRSTRMNNWQKKICH